MIYRFKSKYSISTMCILFEVSRSGYYDWATKMDEVDKDASLMELVMEGYERSRKTYGYRRIKIWLLREYGLLVNAKAVLRIMRKLEISSVARRRNKYKPYGTVLHRYDNILNRDFSAARPNQKWVTDITYIKTAQGVLYLSTIKDLYDGYIVSYRVGTDQSINLVANTIKDALKREVVADGISLHSDQGFQYTSHAYFNLTKEYGIKPSMSRRGNCLDNSPMENFFGHLKSECIKIVKLQTFEEARQLIDDYIYFYNYERIQLKTKLTPFEKRCQCA